MLDLRGEETIWPTNRFMIYALFPQCNVSIHEMWGLKQQNTVLATGKSILDRSVEDEHRRADARRTAAAATSAAGTCQVDNDKADTSSPGSSRGSTRTAEGPRAPSGRVRRRRSRRAGTAVIPVSAPARGS